jgi:putative phosphoribosyl transferase
MASTNYSVQKDASNGAEEERELERQEHDYGEGRPPVDVQGRTAILVDDGLATGSSMRVAVLALN